MARKSNVDSDGQSSGNASSHSDVEMQDRDDKMSGFKKFGVSAIRPAPFHSRTKEQEWRGEKYSIAIRLTA